MTTLALTIEKQARKLSPTERERLAARLMAGMTGERLTSVDEAWVAEAEQRFSALPSRFRSPSRCATSARISVVEAAS